MNNENEKAIASICVELASYRKQSERLTSLIDDCERRIRSLKVATPSPVAAPQKTKRLLPESEVRESFGLSRSTWWRMLRDNVAPEHVKIGDRRYYRPEDISDWLQRHRGGNV